MFSAAVTVSATATHAVNVASDNQSGAEGTKCNNACAFDNLVDIVIIDAHVATHTSVTTSVVIVLAGDTDSLNKPTKRLSALKVRLPRN